jgi:hypothetical protein
MRLGCTGSDRRGSPAARPAAPAAPPRPRGSARRCTVSLYRTGLLPDRTSDTGPDRIRDAALRSCALVGADTDTVISDNEETPTD